MPTDPTAVFSPTTPSPAVATGIFTKPSPTPAAAGAVFAKPSPTPAAAGGVFNTLTPSPVSAGAVFAKPSPTPAAAGAVFVKPETPSIGDMMVSGITVNSNANGLYLKGENINGFPSYSKTGFKMYVLGIASPTWAIVAEMGPFTAQIYTANEYVATPDLVTAWTPSLGYPNSIIVSKMTVGLLAPVIFANPILNPSNPSGVFSNPAVTSPTTPSSIFSPPSLNRSAPPAIFVKP